MSRWLLIAALVAAGVLGATALRPDISPRAETPPVVEPARPDTDQALENAYQSRARNHQVKGSGTVIKLLADDNAGSRHQRFIVRLASGRTLLISHNIDLAPRIDALQVGDTVEFNGEYEWNAKGGVVHWTHHDPQGKHETGWIKHQGRTYR